MRHPYHLIEPSPWPLLISFNILSFLIGIVSLLGGYSHALLTMGISFIMILYIMYLWLSDITNESLILGFHLFKVSRGLIYGFLLFVVTEIMLFFSFFWAYFHSALNPTYSIWPPIGLDLINPWSIPLLNTFLLFYSGIAATWSHHSFLSKDRKSSLISLFIAIILGLIFVFLQYFEYSNSSYDISDSVYSSAFYMLTGLHGMHVLVGITFLIVVLYRIYSYHIPNVIFDLSMIYYHFVDIVWIILFVLIYYLAY